MIHWNIFKLRCEFFKKTSVSHQNSIRKINYTYTEDQNRFKIKLPLQ